MTDNNSSNDPSQKSAKKRKKSQATEDDASWYAEKVAAALKSSRKKDADTGSASDDEDEWNCSCGMRYSAWCSTPGLYREGSKTDPSKRRGDPFLLYAWQACQTCNKQFCPVCSRECEPHEKDCAPELLCESDEGDSTVLEATSSTLNFGNFSAEKFATRKNASL